jgi:hypothetical protein
MLYQLSYASAHKDTLIVTQAILSQQDGRTSEGTGVNVRSGTGPAQRSSVPELSPKYRNPPQMASMAGRGQFCQWAELRPAQSQVRPGAARPSRNWSSRRSLGEVAARRTVQRGRPVCENPCKSARKSPLRGEGPARVPVLTCDAPEDGSTIPKTHPSRAGFADLSDPMRMLKYQKRSRSPAPPTGGSVHSENASFARESQRSQCHSP